MMCREGETDESEKITEMERSNNDRNHIFEKENAEEGVQVLYIHSESRSQGAQGQ